MEAKCGVPFDCLIKLVLIGDSGVGKTCLMLRFTDDKIQRDFVTTLGIDFKIRNIEIDNKRCKLQLWDTAGQERFRTVLYYRRAGGIVAVYDVTDENSFASIPSWMKQIKQHAPDSTNRILIGNKIDLVDLRKIDRERGQQLADALQVPFFETSARANIDVDAAFLSIATDVFYRTSGQEVSAHDAAQEPANCTECADQQQGCC